MNAERLLALYEKVAEATDAVPRLRRFVLDLAVRGKLVPQDAGDEPASELLKRIAAEKARLVKAGEIKRPKPSEPVDEPPFPIPPSWTWTRLGVVASYIQRGKSPKYAPADGSPVISQKCVQWAGLELAAAKQVTLESLAKYETVRLLRDGDLLWNSTGTGTIGRIIRLSEPPDQLVCDSHVTVVRCLEVDPEYVRTWLRTDHVYGVIEDRAAGSTNQVELTAQMANTQPVPLPPLAEQRRIVAKVEELMALLDRLETARTAREAARDRLTAASLARLTAPDAGPADFRANTRFALATLPALTTRPDQIKPLRQTILNLAVRGKLVEQNPTDEPASELLKRIALAKTAAKGRKRARGKGVPAEAETMAADVPTGWASVRLDDVAVSMRYGTSIKCDYDASLVPVLRIPNVSSGQVNLDDMKYGPLSGSDCEALSLEANDLLLIRSNGSLDIVGRAAVVPPEAAGMAFAGYLVRLQTLMDAIDPRYIWLALNSGALREQIERPIRSAVGLKNVNLTEFGNLSFWLPPLAEQHRIVAKVDALMALCDRLEAALTTADTTRARLLEALLHEALDPASEAVTEAAE